MANIGNFKKLDNGSYKGEIATLSFAVKGVTIDPIADLVENGPTYRVHGANGAEIGACWNKTSEAGRSYLSVSLDDPSFPEALYGALVEGRDGSYSLIWNRPDPLANRPGSTPAEAGAKFARRAEA